MQEKIDYLKERIDNITSIIGDEDINHKGKSLSKDNKFETISDSISYIKMQMNDNNITLDILKKSKYQNIFYIFYYSEKSFSFIRY